MLYLHHLSHKFFKSKGFSIKLLNVVSKVLSTLLSTAHVAVKVPRRSLVDNTLCFFLVYLRNEFTFYNHKAFHDFGPDTTA